MERDLPNISDSYKWARETSQALRAGNLAAIDMDALINELDAIASGLRRELLSSLREIIEAMLILEFTNASDKDKAESDLQLVHGQGQLRLILHSVPSLRELIAEAVSESYKDARRFVSEDYGVSLPETCPIALERITEDTYARFLAETESV